MNCTLYGPSMTEPTLAQASEAIGYANLLAGQLSEDIGVEGDEISVPDLLDALASHRLRLVPDDIGVSSVAYLASLGTVLGVPSE